MGSSGSKQAQDHYTTFERRPRAAARSSSGSTISTTSSASSVCSSAPQLWLHAPLHSEPIPSAPRTAPPSSTSRKAHSKGSSGFAASASPFFPRSHSSTGLDSTLAAEYAPPRPSSFASHSNAPSNARRLKHATSQPHLRSEYTVSVPELALPGAVRLAPSSYNASRHRVQSQANDKLRELGLGAGVTGGCTHDGGFAVYRERVVTY